MIGQPQASQRSEFQKGSLDDSRNVVHAANEVTKTSSIADSVLIMNQAAPLTGSALWDLAGRHCEAVCLPDFGSGCLQGPPHLVQTCPTGVESQALPPSMRWPDDSALTATSLRSLASESDWRPDEVIDKRKSSGQLSLMVDLSCCVQQPCTTWPSSILEITAHET